MSTNAAYRELVAALEAAGLRVAVRDGDITPPVVYIRTGSGTDIGGPLDGSRLDVFYLYYIPIRGVDNLEAETSAIDAIYAALTPITWGELPYTSNSSVTVKNETWPCIRFDASLAGITALTQRTTTDAHRR